ncbi:MAG: ABC transporter ATP-binding protein [Alphaproteobacteria bacterium]|nr:ABC transporter ATP-binding protein [Alphaproteobacteria bacterium]
MTRLSLRNISKSFGDVRAVDNVSLEVAAGEFVTLVGGSGCGKTTLLRIVAGFTRPDAGELLIDGRRVEALAPRERNIGFVFQSYALFPTMTVRGNIGFALRLRRRPKPAIDARVDELCALARIGELAERYPHELSGGQQQRVALARALAPNPSILLLDEPLSALDAKIRIALRAEIRSIVGRAGATAVFVTHDQEEALSMSDRVAVMERGQIVQVGTPMEVYFQPVDAFVADFIGVSNRLSARADGEGKVTVSGRPIGVTASTALSGRSDLTLCIRPEHVALDRPGIKCGLPGRIAARTFMGEIVRVEIDVGIGTPVFADLMSDRWMALDLEVGSDVEWRADPMHARLFSGETAVR